MGGIKHQMRALVKGIGCLAYLLREAEVQEVASRRALFRQLKLQDFQGKISRCLPRYAMPSILSPCRRGTAGPFFLQRGNHASRHKYRNGSCLTGADYSSKH